MKGYRSKSRYVIRMLISAIWLLFTFSPIAVKAQTIADAVLNQRWKASWIAIPGEAPNAYGVYLFRKVIMLPAQQSSFIVHVSADNRYQLFVNEKLVSLGPARGDFTHWNYETIDIAPYCKAGENCIAARVWNDGDLKPQGQLSMRTGFIMQGDPGSAEALNTDNTWKCIRDSSYKPIKVAIRDYVAGPGEQVTMSLHQKDWQKITYADGFWKKAQPLFNGVPRNVLGGYGNPSGWMLQPSVIPQMELTPQRLAKVRRAEHVTLHAEFPAVKHAFTVPANTVSTILLDQSYLTNAYPTLMFSGGEGGSVSLTYAEALFSKAPVKGNRNEVAGKFITGRKDSIISDGSNGQTFTALSWRTYRYIQLRITTKGAPLIIDDIYSTFTGYPFRMNAKLETNDPELTKVLETGWRTARLCAMETYMDCPYYEQLQYIGDSRIQALVSMYNSGDDRLLKNALNLMDHSRQPEGITLSRHPSNTVQYIPTFSLWYIGMLHDYLMYGKDTTFAKDKLQGARDVLNFFHGYQQADGSLKGVPYWMFTDWVDTKGWSRGVGPEGKDGNSAITDLQLLWAYQLAADMEDQAGMKAYAGVYQQYAAQLQKTIRLKYWDNNKHLFADRPEKDVFSQHANALAILTETAQAQEVTGIAKKLLADTSLAPASIYFKYYVHQALIKAGLGDGYLDWLGKWHENLSMGMTTWAETSDINTSRSDCHGWGASPNIEFFRTVLGIDSYAPGFSKIKIEPHLGKLTNVSGEIPHPAGKVFAGYTLDKGKWKIRIDLPQNTSGILVWKAKTYPLKAGNNLLEI